MYNNISRMNAWMNDEWMNQLVNQVIICYFKSSIYFFFQKRKLSNKTQSKLHTQYKQRQNEIKCGLSLSGGTFSAAALLALGDLIDACVSSWQIMGNTSDTISEGFPGCPCHGRGGHRAQAGCQQSGQEMVFAVGETEPCSA